MIIHLKNRSRIEPRMSLNTMSVVVFVVVALAVAVSAVTASVAAAEGDPMSGSPGLPEPQVSEGASSLPQGHGYRTAVVACSPAASYAIKADTPSLKSSSVKSTGSVTQTPNSYCLVDQLWLRGQTKVCGFWGCNWHTKASTSSNGRISDWSASVTQDCRGGTHRYRTQTGMSYRTISGHIGIIPTYSYHTKTHESTIKPEFTCT